MTEPGRIRVDFRGRLGQFPLDAAFSGPARGVTALFGPSGCGKTSLLRAMAGLLRLRQGFCAIDGDVWQDGPVFRPPHRRPVGYVFQEASLFPHLSVRRNLTYGAGGGRSPVAPEAIGFDEIVALLGLEPLIDRSPHHLSGGERQRVAIGRALLSRPKLLLMDEPLSALDRRTKDEILPFIEKLCDRLAVPVVYVTHDMAEVERLADHLVLIEAGRVLAAGPLGALQSDSALPLIGQREAAVSLEAVVESFTPVYGLLTLRVEGGRFLVPAKGGAPGEPRRLRIAAGDVSLALDRPQRSTISNVLPARILDTLPGGAEEIIVTLGLGAEGQGARLLSRVTRRSWDLLDLRHGLAVFAQVKSVALIQGRKGRSSA